LLSLRSSRRWASKCDPRRAGSQEGRQNPPAWRARRGSAARNR
jgi:hypothetical protein